MSAGKAAPQKPTKRQCLKASAIEAWDTLNFVEPGLPLYLRGNSPAQLSKRIGA